MRLDVKTTRADPGRLLALLFLLLWCFAMPARALVLSASDGLGRGVQLSGDLEIQRDPSGGWRIADVARGAQQSGFESLEGPVQEGFSRDAVWLRFSLARTVDAPARWLLRVRPPRIHEATLYAPDGRGGFVETPLGDARPFATREIHDHNFVFPLNISTEPAVYFLRVRNDGPSLRAELDLWQPVGFEHDRTADYTIMGMLLGAVLLAICMNLIFGAWLRDGLYAHYALYVLCIAALSINRQGFAAQWFLDARPERVAQTLLAVNCFFNMVGTAFMSRIFQFRRHWPPAAYFFNAVVVFNFAALVLTLVGHQAAMATWASAGSTASTLFGTVFVCYLLFVRRQFQYLLPASAFAVGTVLGLYGLLKLWLGDGMPGVPPDRIYWLGTMCHLVLLNVAVADRTRRAERDYRAERERVRAVRLEAEQALEGTVVRRTAELQQTNAALHEEIAARARLEAWLRESLEVERQAIVQQREFVSMVSHEFRTPLSVIDGAAQSLDISKLGGEPVVKQRTERIRRAVQRLTMLIENILLADRLQPENRVLRLETFEMAALARGLCESFHFPGATRLFVDVREPLSKVRGDRALLEIALQNLMQNALKYSPPEQPVHVVLRQTGDIVQVDMIDRGPGVAMADKARIFEKYFRAKTASAVAGTGLGLHLAREIAMRHGGDVILHETGTSGSTFRLTLPAAPLEPGI
ncbi:His Kinase A (phospho-acceptor) domain-containing protein [Variovorax sp. OK605]|jgi:signal transduction histidine kinase|uniref:sensor histidine kinase n=1 Tax=Variovorax sp. OK605 TaxID=1855317 RepID=UPI0008F17816|nr:sensor histidine kinase [Variovorax sp. OK605]SFQ28719.1 His Kinase A (phospho-acceptor) domain-containing protein [Variovorax sp. OK605]